MDRGVLGLFLVALLLVVVVAAYPSERPISGLTLEVVTAEEGKAKGLSGRDFLPEHQGMLFVWQEVAQRCMWGKDLRFDIDLLFLDGKGTLVRHEPLDAGDPSPHCHEAQYVLEVNRGEPV